MQKFHVFKMRCLRSLTTESGLQSTKIHCKNGMACITLHSGRISMWHENDNFRILQNFHVFKMRCLRSLTTEYGSQSAKIHCKCGTVCGLYSPKTQLYFIKNVDFGIFMPFMGILKQTSLYGL